MLIQKEKKYAKFRFSFILLFIFASFVACFALYMTNDDEEYIQTSKYIDNEDGDESKADELYTSKSVVNPVPKSESAGLDYFNTALILTSAQMGGLSDYIPKENLYIWGSDITDIDNVVVFAKEKNFESQYIILDSECVKSDNLAAISDLINRLKENDSDSAIYIVSVLPITAKKETNEISNSDIDSFNSNLLKLANENSAYYIDINSYFVGNDGKMPLSKTESDGEILNKEVYSEIIDFLLSHIV